MPELLELEVELELESGFSSEGSSPSKLRPPPQAAKARTKERVINLIINV